MNRAQQQKYSNGLSGVNRKAERTQNHDNYPGKIGLVNFQVAQQENAVMRHSAGWRSLPAFVDFIEAVMAPTALLVVALIAGRSGITGGLPIIGLYLIDNFGLEAK
jgi:hypothetical protein